MRFGQEREWGEKSAGDFHAGRLVYLRRVFLYFVNPLHKNGGNGGRSSVG
jgi:hypothetical protein